MKSARLFVVHWNRPDECAQTTRAMTAQCSLLPLVIDNNSEPAAFEKLRHQLDSSVEITRLSQNKGWGPALNAALREWLRNEDSEYAFVSAHDALPSENCLPRLMAAMESDSRIAIACPAYPDGSLPVFSAFHGIAQKIATPPANKTVQQIGVPHGTLMLVRRSALAQIGLFDERYFAYGDEHELGARALRRGWKTVLVWDAIVENPDTSTPAAWRDYLFARNSLLLVRDYFGFFPALLRATIILLNSLRAPTKSSARAIRRGLVDYFFGRFGAPPPSL